LHTLGMLGRDMRSPTHVIRGTAAGHAQKKYVCHFKMIEIVAVAVSSVAGALALLVTTCCFNIRRLRCATIECCGASCTRSPMSREDLEMDTL